MTNAPLSFQEVILSLLRYWGDRGCAVLQPLDLEVGAGTFHPATFLRALGPERWNCVYVQPSRRPGDARYGENPNRLGHYYQLQVILKPSPLEVQQMYLGSLEAIGIRRVQLALDPLRERPEVWGRFGDEAAKRGVTIVSGMFGM